MMVSTSNGTNKTQQELRPTPSTLRASQPHLAPQQCCPHLLDKCCAQRRLAPSAAKDLLKLPDLLPSTLLWLRHRKELGDLLTLHEGRLLSVVAQEVVL